MTNSGHYVRECVHATKRVLELRELTDMEMKVVRDMTIQLAAMLNEERTYLDRSDERGRAFLV